MSANIVVLVLGHGWKLWNLQKVPMCAPMHLDEWNNLVQNASKDSLTFLDFNIKEEPDIHENVCNDWRPLIKIKYDYVIDTICHFDVNVRCYSNYWKGVKFALKDDGVYLGWNDDVSKQHLEKEKRQLRIFKADLDQHVAATYGYFDKCTNSLAHC